VPRFLPLFLIALAVRFGTVALGCWLGALPPDPFAIPKRRLTGAMNFCRAARA